MTTFVLTLIVVAAAFIGMAIGVILSNRRIKGTCGGLANMRDGQGRTLCEACENPSPSCRGEPLQEVSEDSSSPQSEPASAETEATQTAARHG